jgi:putative chitinase
MNVTAKQLAKIAPHAGPKVIEHFLPHLNAAMSEFKIASVRQQAHFLAQFSHETGSMSRMTENFFYTTPERLMKVWPRRFPTVASALPFICAPEKLANHVYAGRMGNGVPDSGDGFRYRGAGGFQLTGKTNQLICAERFNVQPSKIGDWLRSAEGACRSAAWFFTKSGAAVQADLGKVDKVSDIINLGKMTEKVGDAVGYAERAYLTETALKALGA